MEKLTKCGSCGNEMAKSAKVCPNCGAKNKKPFYKKWWIWGIIAVVIIAVGASSGGDKTNIAQTDPSSAVEKTEAITYEVVDLSSMIEDLKNNALKAKNEYQDKYIEVTGKIKNFDSDGQYISIEPTTADMWNFDSMMCYIKDENQKSFLLEKNVGDTVTIKGKVKSIGEVLGYQLDIKEVK